jgi:hypothetical protein
MLCKREAVFLCKLADSGVFVGVKTHPFEPYLGILPVSAAKREDTRRSEARNKEA